MLAGEPFSDRPRCISPAIGGLLRAYNDLVDDDLRQDLYGVVSDVVGSRGTPQVERARVRRVVQWGREMRRRRGLSLMLLPAREPNGAEAESMPTRQGYSRSGRSVGGGGRPIRRCSR